MFAKYKRATWLIGISQFSSNQAPIHLGYVLRTPKTKTKKGKKKKSKTLLGCSQAPEQ